MKTKIQKINAIAKNFGEILKELGLNLDSDGLKDTPQRFAKMLTEDMCVGLDKEKEPKATMFKNQNKYTGLLVEKNIRVVSLCEHHFLPVIGVCHIAYIPKKKIIGLSKLNRIVDYLSRKPSTQEFLTEEIHTYLKTKLETNDIAVIMECSHSCLTLRGIKDKDSKTVTSKISGSFFDDSVNRSELMQFIK